MRSSRQVVLITGTSSGIGAECARYLVRRGYRVYGGSRSRQIAYKNFIPLLLDVTNDRSVKLGIQQVLDREGRIDVVINNAGIAYAGSVEDTALEEAQHQFDVNFFGVLRVCKAVLPVMRKQGKGFIINISSIGGLIGLPYQAFYSATKFALEGLTEGMRLEVRNTGIQVVLVEPGDIKTNISQNRLFSELAGEGSAYFDAFRNYVSSIAESEQQAPGPEIVAKKVHSILRKRTPGLRYRVGSFQEHLAVVLRKALPSRLFEKILASSFKV